MLGAMAAQPKVRKVAQRQQKTKLGVLEKPKEIQNVRTEDKQVRNRFSAGPEHAKAHCSLSRLSGLLYLHPFSSL